MWLYIPSNCLPASECSASDCRAGLRYLGIETRTVCYLEREAFIRQRPGGAHGRRRWMTRPSGPTYAPSTLAPGVVRWIASWRLSVPGPVPLQAAGLDGKRSGLFFELLRIAEDSGARYLFLENVGGIAFHTSVVDETEGLSTSAQPASWENWPTAGGTPEWLTLSASDVGASHGRRTVVLGVEKWTTPSVDVTDAGSGGNISDRDACLARTRDVADTGLQHRDLQQRAHELNIRRRRRCG